MPAPAPRHSDALRGLVLGVIAVTIFGLTLPATRIGVAEIDPILFGLGRTVLPGLLSAILLVSTRQPLASSRDFLLLVVTAAGVVIGFPALATIAMQQVPAAHGGVVLALLPLASALAGTLIGGERPSLGFWLCALIGSALVVVFALSRGGGTPGTCNRPISSCYSRPSAPPSDMPPGAASRAISAAGR